jgi:endonuclease/exonuclease/phosphatase family metal-dependent hydrolase
MKIVSLNGWGGVLHKEVQAFLGAESPDVLCLQEVVHTPSASKDWLTYRDQGHELPQRANFFQDVCEALPGHSAQFLPAAQGVLWDGGELIPSQWGLATFVRKNYPIIGQAQGFVHKDFSPDGYGEHPRCRNAHVVRLFNFEKGWPITIAHMHGLRDLAGKGDTPERVEQAVRLTRLVQSVAQPTDRIVVCGDFNVEPTSQTFTALSEVGLRDLVTAFGHSDTRTSHYKKLGRFADYMLVNGNVDVKAFKVIEHPEVSDHRPILLEV